MSFSSCEMLAERVVILVWAPDLLVKRVLKVFLPLLRLSISFWLPFFFDSSLALCWMDLSLQWMASCKHSMSEISPKIQLWNSPKGFLNSSESCSHLSFRSGQLGSPTTNLL